MRRSSGHSNSRRLERLPYARAGAYVDAVMEAQKDLVEVVHTLMRVVWVKG